MKQTTGKFIWCIRY